MTNFKHTVDPVVVNGLLLFYTNHFSNWHKSAFKLDDQIYNCVEQWMMAEKARLFKDHETEKLIMATDSPREQKALGRQVKNFDAEKWSKVCDDIVFNGCFAKYNQNDSLKAQILATEDLILVEASANDKIWGIGLSMTNPDAQDPAKWQGENRLGKALMRVREALRNS